MSNVITKEMLMSTAPTVLLNDPEMRPLVELAAEEMAKFYAACSLPNIYSRIDELPEDLLDILAEDFKVDWYDYNYDIETKRAVLRDSFFVHRHLGTVAAVETALKDVWPSARVEEWFDYSGPPYHFRIYVAAQWSQETEDTIRRTVEKYKNARSVLDGVQFNAGEVDAPMLVGSAVCGVDLTYTAEMM